MFYFVSLFVILIYNVGTRVYFMPTGNAKKKKIQKELCWPYAVDKMFKINIFFPPFDDGLRT